VRREGELLLHDGLLLVVARLENEQNRRGRGCFVNNVAADADG